MARARKKTDEILLAALARGATIESAAQTAGISARTAHRRLKEPAIQERVQQARADMVERTAAVLTAGGLQSAKTLITLQQTAKSDSVRLGAARSTIELGAKMRDASDLAQRLAALEAKMNAAGSPKEGSTP